MASSPIEGTINANNSIDVTEVFSVLDGDVEAPGVVVNEQKCHHWQFMIVDQVENKSKEVVIDYPFLDDENGQDYLFTKHLLIEAPYKVGLKVKGVDRKDKKLATN